MAETMTMAPVIALWLLLACSSAPAPDGVANPAPTPGCQVEGSFPPTSAALVEAQGPALAACMAQTPGVFDAGPYTMEVSFYVATPEGGAVRRGRSWSSAAPPARETSRCIDQVLQRLEEEHPDLRPGGNGGVTCTLALVAPG